MAFVFRTFDRKTGKAHPKWKYRIVDWDGRRKTATGSTSEGETKRMALQAEARAARIRAGLEAAPTSSHKHRHRPFDEVKGEYLAWGGAQGGKHGRPWCSVHANTRERALTWWKERLGLETLIDLDGVLPRVEEALRELQVNHAGKTLQNTVEALKSFCRWAVQRGYLQADPLTGLAPFNTTPETIRRAMTADEVRALLKVAPNHRRLLYEVALTTGLRKNELRWLSVDDLDVDGCGLRLHSQWTKNRKPGFQALPAALVERLKAFIESGRAADLYRVSLRRKGSTMQVPENPLLFVGTHAARELDADLAAAGISKDAPGGKLDFHALCVSFISRVIESGASVKEAMSLARHSSPNLTLNVYGRTREARLGEIVEHVGGGILPDETGCESPTTAQLRATGTESACPTGAYGEVAAGQLPEATDCFSIAPLRSQIEEKDFLCLPGPRSASWPMIRR